MRRLAVIILIVALMWAPLAGADETESFFGTDKIKHFVACFVISTIAYNVFRTQTNLSDGESRAAAFGSAMLVGLGKEWSDEDFSWKDLTADAAGAGLGVAAGIKIKF